MRPAGAKPSAGRRTFNSHRDFSEAVHHFFGNRCWANFHGCFSTNSFDLAVYACLFVAVVMGFMTGLLRSLATIIGYIWGAASPLPRRQRPSPS
jgi:hypothetical protein